MRMFGEIIVFRSTVPKLMQVFDFSAFWLFGILSYLAGQSQQQKGISIVERTLEKVS